MADIELVIKIDDETYKQAINRTEFDTLSLGIKLIEAVQNGTPLPKGHGDLIDVNRKITVPIYDEQYEEWGEKTLTVLEALNKWSDEGVTVKDIVIPADKDVQE